MRDHAKLTFELAKVFEALVRFFTNLTDFSLKSSVVGSYESDA